VHSLELSSRLRQNEADLNVLARFIQTASIDTKNPSIENHGRKWIDSIHSIILNFAELREVSQTISFRPPFYFIAESYLQAVISSLQFFHDARIQFMNFKPLLSRLTERLEGTKNFLRVKPRSIETPQMPFFERPFDFQRFGNGFGGIICETSEPISQALVAISRVLGRPFDVFRGTQYCFDLIQFISNIHISIANSAPINLEPRLSELSVKPEALRAVGTFERQRLMILLLVIDLLTRIVEFELSLCKTRGIKIAHGWRFVQNSYMEFKTEFAKIFDGTVSELIKRPDTVSNVCNGLKSLFQDLKGISRRLCRMSDSHQELVFLGDVSDDQIGSIRFIPKVSDQKPLKSHFSKFLEDFESRSTMMFIPAFVAFCARALSCPILHGQVNQLRDVVVELLTNRQNEVEVQRGLDEFSDLANAIARRIELLESDELEMVLGVLSFDLVEFNPTRAPDTLRVIVANVIELLCLFLSHCECHELKLARDVGVAFESFVDLCRQDFLDETVDKVLDMSETLVKLMPAKLLGSFAAKLRLRVAVRNPRELSRM
jgi:hypothetical protein